MKLFSFYSGQPESPSHLLQFIAEVHTFYIQQRSRIKPVIVHCRWVYCCIAHCFSLFCVRELSRSTNKILEILAVDTCDYIPAWFPFSDGIGRTGAFLVIYTGVQEVNQGNPMIDVIPLVKELRGKRKHMIGEKEQLKFCFNTILYHCQDILMKSKCSGLLMNVDCLKDCMKIITWMLRIHF